MRVETTTAAGLILIALAGCGAPPDTAPATPAAPSAPAAIAHRIPSGATLSDSRPDPNPIPEDALVVNQKPWDRDYEVGKFGGNLVTAAFADPKTFNWIVSNETSSSDIWKRMQSDLVHVNAESQDVELALAKKYEVAPDGKSMTLWLRKGILWSDGEPFDADDVVFTWNAIFDPDVRSPAADVLSVEGKPIAIAKIDAYTVRLDFPSTVAVPERLLSGVEMLPEHKLGASLKDHSFSSQWGVGMNPADFVTVGPFKLRSYEAQQKTVLERNPHFWKLDKEKHRLPYLDSITILSVPDFNSERLKYQNLETHCVKQVRQEDYADLKKMEAEKDWTVYNLGPSNAINFLWFNQNQASQVTVGEKSYMVFPGDVVKEQSRLVEGQERAKVLKGERKPFVDPVKLAWFRDKRFRVAVAHAINKDGIIRSVFYGLGVPLSTGISPGNKFWHNPSTKSYPYDLEVAKKLLQDAGYVDTDGDGIRESPKGHPIEFSLVTNKGNEAREKMATIIAEDLGRLGMRVNFKPIDFNSLITKLHSTFDYEGAVLSLVSDDVDPVDGLNTWKSSGFTHQWAPFQPSPSTDYEKHIDDLLVTVQTSQDQEARRKAFFEMQEVLAEEQPMNWILSVILPTSARNCVGNLRPAVLEHFSLHNAEFLYFKY
ncbi:MAG: ABC transporter substrate-binding protein [Acidobacteriota bacterium]